jgi:hypothetical protein
LDVFARKTKSAAHARHILRGETVNDAIELVVRSISIGALATLTMDGWAALLRKFGIPSLDFALLGRWLGHLPEGRFVHESIAKAAPVRGERLIGWGAHYAIGVSFAGVLIAVFGLDWARTPSIGPALVIGLVTVVAPLFVLQPALGAGMLSRKTPKPVFNTVKSVVTHTIFGFGLFFAAKLTAALLPGGT